MCAKVMSKRTFPWTTRIDGHEITFRIMSPKDRDALLEFTQSLDAEDLIFLRMDITKPEVIDEWVNNVKLGRTITILAEDEDGVVGYGSLHKNELTWTRHLGEIRLFVLRALRGIGLGERLAHELSQIARDQKLERLVVNIPSTQPNVRKMLEKLSFHVEALMTDWLKDQKGHNHDLIIMSQRLEQF